MEAGTIRLYVCAKDYIRFCEKQKELFTEETQERYSVEFPMEFDAAFKDMEAPSIEEYVIACCETALILPDQKYELNEETEFDCQIMKITKGEKIFNMLLTIHYPKIQEAFHDILFFREIGRSETHYAFEFSGDQTLFAL